MVSWIAVREDGRAGRDAQARVSASLDTRQLLLHHAQPEQAPDLLVAPEVDAWVPALRRQDGRDLARVLVKERVGWDEVGGRGVERGRKRGERGEEGGWGGGDGR